MLRCVQHTRRYFENVDIRWRNVITFFRTYCVSTKTQVKPYLAGNDKRDGNSEQTEITRSVTIDETTIRRIERLALVGFEYEHSKRVLEEAITFAERLRRAHIDETVRPMYSILENEHIHLRDDVSLSHDTANRCEILKNAALLEEGYFVSPLSTATKASST